MLRTLRELRDKSGVNKGTISQIERGRIVANPDELGALSRALGRRLEVRTLAIYEDQDAA